MKLELSQGELKEVSQQVSLGISCLRKNQKKEVIKYCTTSLHHSCVLPQMSQKVTTLEQEIERLGDGGDLENVSYPITLITS